MTTPRHGTADWGLTAGTVTTYQLTDLAELAARLGSIVTYDRRGEVLFIDDFSHGVSKWAEGGGGGDPTITLSAVQSRSGQFSALLTPASGGLTQVIILRAVPALAPSAIGLECHLAASSPAMSFQWDLRVKDATTSHRFAVRYNAATGDLQYLDDSAAWVAFAAPGDVFEDPTVFHAAKLVVNADLDAYDRFLLDGTAYSLSGFTHRETADVSVPIIFLLITAEDLTGSQNPAYLDDVILTQNKPPSP